jgi:hypothetical protein
LHGQSLAIMPACSKVQSPEVHNVPAPVFQTSDPVIDYFSRFGTVIKPDQEWIDQHATFPEYLDATDLYFLQQPNGDHFQIYAYEDDTFLGRISGDFNKKWVEGSFKNGGEYVYCIDPGDDCTVGTINGGVIYIKKGNIGL